MDRVMQLLEVPSVPVGQMEGYYLKRSDDATFFTGSCAQVIAYGTTVGRIGVLHPETITKFELDLPCTALEITIEPFL